MRFQRACGTLLHPTSLPGTSGSGDLGAAAYRFVDWLQAAEQGCWQFLPLGGIGRGNSPYMSDSAFAGNMLLVDLAELHERGWLAADEIEPAGAMPDDFVDYPRVIEFRLQRLQRAAQRFAATAGDRERNAFAEFCGAEAPWLDDYALFMTLAELFPGRDWCDWEAPLAQRDPAALRQARIRHAARIDFYRFCQWCFFRQWRRLRGYAHARGVELIGDAPIYLAYHSAEVWARRELFELDEDGRQAVVAGVPPDYFSASGQRWGNPLYRWQAHRQQNFSWWIERIRHNLRLFDRLRIDHFIGFVRCWEIPAAEPTAINGRWLDSPGAELFAALADELGPLPIIAEDLGLVTDEVHALREQLGFPGMRVLQFAWRSDDHNPHLPHNHTPNSVVYTGTHDNDTILGWWSNLEEGERRYVQGYLGSDCADPAWTLIDCALASSADTAIIPLQDYLGLDTGHRMNVPGEPEGNWRWRFHPVDLDDALAARIASLCRQHGRAPRH